LVISRSGLQTAGLRFGGGGPVTNTEEYDGSAWTAGGALGTARKFSRMWITNSRFRNLDIMEQQTLQTHKNTMDQLGLLVEM
jgi:hypothetical protein